MTQSLASQERSKKRELFEQIKREKELALREEQEKIEQDRLKKEEEEIKKIRAQQHFKATPVKIYSKQLPVIEEKALTVPIGPKLATKERAGIKEDVE